uniref:Uncharacterized protein n=1 Tax=Anguilla anguilla TaxID=7936 RepID=A0A0E9Q7L9_ANGAN
MHSIYSSEKHHLRILGMCDIKYFFHFTISENRPAAPFRAPTELPIYSYRDN